MFRKLFSLVLLFIIMFLSTKLQHIEFSLDIMGLLIAVVALLLSSSAKEIRTFWQWPKEQYFLAAVFVLAWSVEYYLLKSMHIYANLENLSNAKE